MNRNETIRHAIGTETKRQLRGWMARACLLALGMLAMGSAARAEPELKEIPWDAIARTKRPASITTLKQMKYPYLNVGNVEYCIRQTCSTADVSMMHGTIRTRSENDGMNYLIPGLAGFYAGLFGILEWNKNGETPKSTALTITGSALLSTIPAHISWRKIVNTTNERARLTEHLTAHLRLQYMADREIYLKLRDTYTTCVTW